MTKLNKDQFAAIRAAVDAVTPPSWCWKLTQQAGSVVMKITEAPINLVAVDAELYGSQNRGYARVCPTAYEDRADLPVAAIWQALNIRNTTEFDGAGDRSGSWYIAELWFGDWRTPFKLTAVQ